MSARVCLLSTLLLAMTVAPALLAPARADGTSAAVLDPRAGPFTSAGPHEAPGGGYMDERLLGRQTVVLMLRPHATPGLLWLTAQVQGMSGLPESDIRLAAHLSSAAGTRTLNPRPLGRGVFGAPVALTAAPYLVQVQVARGAMAQVVGFRFIVVHLEGPVVVPGSLPDPRDKPTT